MAVVINMPRLSDTMEEGTVAKWHKQVGDTIQEGDILAEIETDKATMDFESFHEGTLLHIGTKEGETTAVDKLLAIVGEEGEDISGILAESSNSESKSKSEASNEKSSAEPSENKTKDTASTASSSTETKIPEGVTVVTMPRLSDTMEKGTVAKWHKQVGDSVKEGDILAEIETDKATLDFESFYEGTLLYIGTKEGETTAVDDLLAIIGPKGTDVSNIAKNYKAEEKAPNSKMEDKPTSAPEKSESETDSSLEQPETKENNSMSQSNGRIFASPLAKRIAADKNINLKDVNGSGENGRIVKRDVQNYKPKEASPKKEVSAATAVFGEENYEDVKHSQVRKVIAKRLLESKNTAPHYYLNVEFNMDNAIEVRKQINSLPDTKISFNDMIIKACALALRRFPQVNSSWHNEFTRINKHVHIGVAVATEYGLVVPVLRFANQLSLQQISNNIVSMAGKAQERKLTPEDMSGSTFTISNLGKFGIESFTSIINQPNSAILSVGGIVQKPIVKDGQVVVGNTMKLTMACDHRVVDGAVGAEFLQVLRHYIENPATMLA